MIDSTRFLFNQSMESPDVLQVASGEACFYSRRCPGKEGANEDSAAIIPIGPHSAVFVVADGLGGSAAGEVASKMAVESVVNSVCSIETTSRVRTAILDDIERANQQIQDLQSGAATTICVIELDNHVARPYHVGDSTIVIVGGRGRTKFQSISHSPVGYGVEAGLIDEDEALAHDERHIVSNVVGSAKMGIEIGPSVALSPRDRILLATDGLADNLLPAEISDLARSGTALKSGRRIASVVGERMATRVPGVPSKRDDLTFILYRAKASRTSAANLAPSNSPTM